MRRVAMVIVGLIGASRAAAPPMHRVSGKVSVSPSAGFSFAMTIDIQQDSSGNVSGRVLTKIIDLSAHGVTTTGDIEQEPQCMRVVGTTAYISTVVTKTSDERLQKIGDRAVIWVKDAGPGGVDVAYGGPARTWDPSNAVCTSTPPRLPATLVSEGDIVVR